MTTALDIITDALVKIRVYSEGESIADVDAERCLTVANDMLDSWSNESLTCFAILEQSTTLQVGISAYTIGVGGMLNMTRPLRLIGGPGMAYILDPSGNKYPVNVVPQDQWNLIGNIAQVNSNVPDTLFYDPQFPLGILNFFPTPNIGWQAFWDSYLQLTDLAVLSSSVSLPPGYVKALKDCLAVEIWPYFKDGEVSPSIAQFAAQSKGNIKRTNIRENVALYDPEIVSRAQGSYNIFSDRNG